MAKITLTLNEIFQIAKKNEILPKQIKSICSKNNNIRLKIKPMVFIPNLNVDLEFENYKNGVIFLKLSSNFIARQLPKYLKQLTKPDWIELQNKQILISPNKIIRNYVNGIEIKNLYFEDNLFIIETKNVS